MAGEDMSDGKLNDKDEQELAAESIPDTVTAWEQIEPGRFMPRRVRGSCRGLALG
jgi:hypothetical protein